MLVPDETIKLWIQQQGKLELNWEMKVLTYLRTGNRYWIAGVKACPHEYNLLEFKTILLLNTTGFKRRRHNIE